MRVVFDENFKNYKWIKMCIVVKIDVDVIVS